MEGVEGFEGVDGLFSRRVYLILTAAVILRIGFITAVFRWKMMPA